MPAALRQVALAAALVAAWLPILAFRWWALAVTVPALAAAAALDADLDGGALD